MTNALIKLFFALLIITLLRGGTGNDVFIRQSFQKLQQSVIVRLYNYQMFIKFDDQALKFPHVNSYLVMPYEHSREFPKPSPCGTLFEQFQQFTSSSNSKRRVELIVKQFVAGAGDPNSYNQTV